MCCCCCYLLLTDYFLNNSCARYILREGSDFLLSLPIATVCPPGLYYSADNTCALTCPEPILSASEFDDVQGIAVYVVVFYCVVCLWCGVV